MGLLCRGLRKEIPGIAMSGFGVGDCWDCHVEVWGRRLLGLPCWGLREGDCRDCHVGVWGRRLLGLLFRGMGRKIAENAMLGFGVGD